MSRVSDVIVSADAQEAALEPLTRRDDSRAWSGVLAPITGRDADRFWVHDGKGPVSDIWVGTFSGLDRAALLADLERLPWTCPHSVQVLIRDDQDDCFGLWMLHEGRLREVPLPATRRDPQTGILIRVDCPGDDV